MREENLNEFELQERQSTEIVAQGKKNKFRGRINREKETEDVSQTGEVLNRLDSLEHHSLVFETLLTPLTPSDDLEAVKAMLNQIIEAINKD